MSQARTGRSGVSGVSGLSGSAGSSVATSQQGDAQMRQVLAAREKLCNERIVDLITSAYEGDRDKMDKLLRIEYLSVNTQDYDGRAMAHLAAAEGRQHMLEVLLRKGADANLEDRYGGRPADDAVRGLHWDCLRVLQRYGGTMGGSPRQQAVRLTREASAGRIEVVRALLEAGADVRATASEGRTALHAAACGEHLDVMALLLERGADVNAKDVHGATALQDCVRERRAEPAALLRERGGLLGDLDAVAELCEAARCNDVETVRLLAENGADVNAGDYDQRTCLHLAASEGQLDVVTYLLRRGGVRINPIDRWGGTPLEDALREKHPVVAKLLQDAGGRRSSDKRVQRLLAERTAAAAAAGEAAATATERRPSAVAPAAAGLQLQMPELGLVTRLRDARETMLPEVDSLCAVLALVRRNVLDRAALSDALRVRVTACIEAARRIAEAEVTLRTHLHKSYYAHIVWDEHLRAVVSAITTAAAAAEALCAELVRHQ